MLRLLLTISLLCCSLIGDLVCIDGLSPNDDNDNRAVRLIEPLFTNKNEIILTAVKISDLPNPVVAVGTSANRIHLYDPFTQTLIYTFHRFSADRLRDDCTGVTTLASSILNVPPLFRKQSCLIAGYADGAIRVWDLETHRLTNYLHNHTRPITELLVLSPTLLASTSTDERITIWDLTTNAPLHTIRSYGTQLQKLPNGMLAAVTCSESAPIRNHETEISIWNPQTGKCLKKLRGHTYGINALAPILGPNNKPLLISGTARGEIKIWNLFTYKCLFTLRLPDCFPVSFTSLSNNNVALIAAKDIFIIDLLKKSYHLLTQDAQISHAKSYGSNLLAIKKNRIYLYDLGNLNHSFAMGFTTCMPPVESVLFSDGTIVLVYKDNLLVNQEKSKTRSMDHFLKLLSEKK